MASKTHRKKTLLLELASFTDLRAAESTLGNVRRSNDHHAPRGFAPAKPLARHLSHGSTEVDERPKWAAVGPSHRNRKFARRTPNDDDQPRVSSPAWPTSRSERATMGVFHHPNAHEREPRRVSGPSRRKFGDKKLEPKVLVSVARTERPWCGRRRSTPA